MATTTEILRIEVDNEQAQKNIEEQTRLIEGLRSKNKELQKQNKELSKDRVANSKQIAQNSEQIAKNSAVITQATAKRKQSIAVQKNETGTLNNLRSQLALLTAQRNKDLKVGSAAFNQANKNIASLNKQIKAAEEAGGDFRRSVGNYSGALGKSQEALSAVNPALGGFVSGIVNATKASLAFIATPIGAVIAAVAAGLASVVAFFKRSEEGGDRLAKVIGFLTGAFEASFDIISALGKLIIDSLVTNFRIAADRISIFVEDFKQSIINLQIAYNDLIGDQERVNELTKELTESQEREEEAVKSLNKNIEDNNKRFKENTENLLENVSATEEKIERSIRVAELERGLEKQIIASTKAQAENNRQIFEGLKIAKDETLSFEERRKGLEQAAKAEQDLADTNLRIARQRAAIAKESFAINDSTLEDRKELVEAEAAVIEAETASLRTQTKIQSTRITFLKQEEAEKKRIADEESARIKKQQEDEFALDLFRKEQSAKRLEDQEAQIQAELEIERFKLEQSLNNEDLSENEKILLKEQSAARELEIIERSDAEKDKLRQNETKKINDEEKKREQIRKERLNNGLNLTKAAVELASNIIGQETKAGKALAIAAAGINTAQAVTRTLATGGALAIPQAAVVAATGAAQIAKIKSTDVSGGSSGGSTSSTNLSSAAGQISATPQVDTSNVDNQVLQQDALIQALESQRFQVSVTEINEAQNSVAVSEADSSI